MRYFFNSYNLIGFNKLYYWCYVIFYQGYEKLKNKDESKRWGGLDADIWSLKDQRNIVYVQDSSGRAKDQRVFCACHKKLKNWGRIFLKDYLGGLNINCAWSLKKTWSKRSKQICTMRLCFQSFSTMWGI
jgi:hypothetical protein